MCSLGENRHNTVYFPNVMLKGPIQLLRLFKPVAANKTLVESWTYRLVGAPDMLLERTVMYNYPATLERSLRWVAVHTVHEVHHHLLDVRRQLAK